MVVVVCVRRPMKDKVAMEKITDGKGRTERAPSKARIRAAEPKMYIRLAGHTAAHHLSISPHKHQPPSPPCSTPHQRTPLHKPRRSLSLLIRGHRYSSCGPGGGSPAMDGDSPPAPPAVPVASMVCTSWAGHCQSSFPSPFLPPWQDTAAFALGAHARPPNLFVSYLLTLHKAGDGGQPAGGGRAAGACSWEVHPDLLFA